MASSRLRNSGLKTRSTASLARSLAVFDRAAGRSPPPKPMVAAFISREPALDVRIRIDLPEVGLAAGVVGQRGVVHHLQQDVVDVRDAPSRSRPSARPRTGACGRRRPAGRPARSRRSPGGAPMSRATACFSMYSDMSKRMNSLPRWIASCLASSVLPTPVGPVNRKQPGRAVGLAEAGARPLDGRRHQLHRLVLAEHDALQRLLERAQPLAVRRAGLLLRDARHARHDALDVVGR